jgi:hypothetical protein
VCLGGGGGASGTESRRFDRRSVKARPELVAWHEKILVATRLGALRAGAGIKLQPRALGRLGLEYPA